MVLTIAGGIILAALIMLFFKLFFRVLPYILIVLVVLYFIGIIVGPQP